MSIDIEYHDGKPIKVEIDPAKEFKEELHKDTKVVSDFDAEKRALYANLPKAKAKMDRSITARSLNETSVKLKSLLETAYQNEEEDRRSFVPIVAVTLNNINGLITADTEKDNNDPYIIRIPVRSDVAKDTIKFSRLQSKVLERLKSSKTLHGSLSYDNVNGTRFLTLKLTKNKETYNEL